MSQKSIIICIIFSVLLSLQSSEALQLSLHGLSKGRLLATINVGAKNKSLSVLVDTGSSYFVLFKNTYEPESMRISSESFNLAYASGTITGYMYAEDIVIGGEAYGKVPMIIQSSSDNEDFLSDPDIDGILGLGLPGLADKHYTTFLETIFSNVTLEDRSFAICYWTQPPMIFLGLDPEDLSDAIDNNDGNGEPSDSISGRVWNADAYIIPERSNYRGFLKPMAEMWSEMDTDTNAEVRMETDTDTDTDTDSDVPFTVVPMTTSGELGYWMFSLKRITFDGNLGVLSGPFNTIIDSGTPIHLISPAVYQQGLAQNLWSTLERRLNENLNPPSIELFYSDTAIYLASSQFSICETNYIERTSKCLSTFRVWEDMPSGIDIVLGKVAFQTSNIVYSIGPTKNTLLLEPVATYNNGGGYTVDETTLQPLFDLLDMDMTTPVNFANDIFTGWALALPPSN